MLIVQFVSGDYILTLKDGKEKKLEYKDIIGSGYKVSDQEGSHAKIVTVNRCIFVLHKGSVETTEEQWILNGKTRIICPGSQKENFVWQERNFALADGEVFLYDNKIHVLKGAVTFNSKTYPRGYYQLSQDSLVPSEDKLSPLEHYEINTELGVPAESVYFGKPPPSRAATSRWYFGVSPMGKSALAHSNSSYSFDGGRSHWIRLERSAPFKQGGFGISIAIFDSKNGDDDESDGSSGSGTGNYRNSLDLETTHLDVFYKFNWNSTFTPYVGLGIFHGNFDIHTNDSSNPNKRVDAQSNYLGTNVSLGLEKFFFSQSGISFFIRAEINWLRSWVNLGVEPKGNSTANSSYPKNGEDGAFDNLGAHIMIGPLIQFF
jgi:hypothetical protein